MNQDPQIAKIARKLIWWQEPDISLAQPARFIMRVMTLGTWEDTQMTIKVYGREVFKHALLNAEPGVFDCRSWAYWHAVFGMECGPLPKRSLK